jgi:hypothetical protein
MTARFERDVLDRLEAANTVRIETHPRPGTGDDPRRTTIWIMVEGGEVYVRSVRGPRGRWYRDLLADPRGTVVTRRPAGPPVPVEAVLAADPESIERCTAALRRKYAGDPALETMLRPDTLATTMRLQPR